MPDGIRAVMAAANGERSTARTLATAALAAAEVDDWLGWGRQAVGLVRPTDTIFHANCRHWQVLVPSDC